MNKIITDFNNISIDFLTQTAPITGYTYLYKFKMLTNINCIYAIDKFIENVLPYKNRIINKDESFFMNKNIDSEYINDIIGIKQIYHTLDNESKENIWNILMALVYLAEERYLNAYKYG